MKILDQTPFGFVSLSSSLDSKHPNQKLCTELKSALTWKSNIILDWKRRPPIGDWIAPKSKYFDGQQWLFSFPYNEFVLETYNEVDKSCGVFVCQGFENILSFHASVYVGNSWLIPDILYYVELNDIGNLRISANKEDVDAAIATTFVNLLLDRVSYFNSCPGDSDVLVHCATDENDRVNTRRINNNKKPIYEFKIAFVNGEPSSPRRAYQGGTHASPTMHRRRGHFRKWKDTEIWIESCVVGLAKNGITHKGYLVNG